MIILLMCQFCVAIITLSLLSWDVWKPWMWQTKIMGYSHITNLKMGGVVKQKSWISPLFTHFWHGYGIKILQNASTSFPPLLFDRSPHYPFPVCLEVLVFRLPVLSFNPSTKPKGSMGLVYLPTNSPYKSTIHVGKIYHSRGYVMGIKNQP